MKTGYSLKQYLILFMAAYLGPPLILLYGFTWRLKWDGIENLERARGVSGNVLFAFWHSRLLGLCYAFRYRNAGILVSKSFDGEWIARLITRLGYRVFRGSASRDGAAGLLEMVRNNMDGDLALTVDGPKGPAEKVKPGVVALAARSGLAVVPITIMANRSWRLRSWDSFIIPKPFATVTISCGPHFEIPEDSGRSEMDEYSSQIENSIAGLG